MGFSWSIFVDLGIIAVAMLAATALRVRVRLLQRFLVPNALTAGLLLLPLYNFVFPHLGMTTANLEMLTYHLLSIAFVAMAIRPSAPGGEKGDGRIFGTSVSIIAQFAVQAGIGLLLTLLLIRTIMPDLYHSFGFLLPLGFAQGPGQALSIGQGWESAGIQGAGSVGLTFAAVGFLLSCAGGVFLINYGLRNGWVSEEEAGVLQTDRVKTGIYRNGNRPVGSYLTTESEAIDSMTFNTAMVLVSYLLAFLVLTGLEALLSQLGQAGADLATNLWGIGFIFAAMMALVVKQIMRMLGLEYLLETHTLNRLSGLSVDIMVAAGIGAISLIVVLEYLLPIVLLSVVGAGAVFAIVPWMCSRIFRDQQHRFIRTLLIFGVSTGTLTTGLALVRVLDPDFETPVANDYAYASGLTFMLVIPLILSINLPVMTWQTGNMIYFWITIAVIAGYLIFSAVSYLFIARERAFKKRFSVWLRHGGE